MAKKKPPALNQPAGKRTGRHLLAVIAVLATITVAVFGQTRRFDFLLNWDDREYVTDNPQVRQGLSVEGLRYAFTSNVAGNWHPLTIISHQMDVELFGLNAGWHHVTSSVLHFANSILVYLLLVAATGSSGRSAVVAAVFLAHPLHVESVAWVSERKDVLSAFFSLLTMLAYVRYTTRAGVVRYVTALALYGLALMAKPMAVTVPVLLLLVDMWPLGRFKGDRPVTLTAVLSEKIPFLIVASAVGLITLQTQADAGALTPTEYTGIADRVAQALVSYVMYLWKTIWPIGLAAFYPQTVTTAGTVMAAVVILAAISIASFGIRRRAPYLLMGWAWFIVSLSPVIGLIQFSEQGLADRYMYLPLLGLAVAFVWSASALSQRLGIPARAAAGIAAVVVITLSWTGRVQASHWANGERLWRHTIDVTVTNYRAYENLGTVLMDRRDFDGAIAAFVECRRQKPAYAGAPNNIGLALTRQGRNADAVPWFVEAVRLEPDFFQARTNLANALAQTRQFEQAIDQFSESIRRRQSDTAPRIGLGSVLLQANRAGEAEQAFTDVIRLAPALPEGHAGLGAALALQSRHDEAVEKYRRALQLKPGHVTTLTNLALSLMNLKRWDEARASLEEALRIEPNYDLARRALAQIKDPSR